jgi:hypothetical protein
MHTGIRISKGDVAKYALWTLVTALVLYAPFAKLKSEHFPFSIDDVAIAGLSFMFLAALKQLFHFVRSTEYQTPVKNFFVMALYATFLYYQDFASVVDSHRNLPFALIALYPVVVFAMCCVICKKWIAALGAYLFIVACQTVIIHNATNFHDRIGFVAGSPILS